MHTFADDRDGWSEAFAYCREKNHPVRVLMVRDDSKNGNIHKLYPSGKADFIITKPLEA